MNKYLNQFNGKQFRNCYFKFVSIFTKSIIKNRFTQLRSIQDDCLLFIVLLQLALCMICIQKMLSEMFMFTPSLNNFRIQKHKHQYLQSYAYNIFQIEQFNRKNSVVKL